MIRVPLATAGELSPEVSSSFLEASCDFIKRFCKLSPISSSKCMVISEQFCFYFSWVISWQKSHIIGLPAPEYGGLVKFS